MNLEAACGLYTLDPAMTREDVEIVTACLRQILDGGQEGILTVDHDERVQFVNRLVCDWFETQPTELIGSRLADFFEGINLGILRDLIDVHMRGQEPIRPTVEMRIGGGQLKDVEVDVIVAETCPRGLVHVMLRDRTERLFTEGALRNANVFFKKLLDSTVDGIIAADTNGRLILFNQGAERLLGYTAREAMATLHVSQLYPDGEARRIMRMMRSPDHGGEGKCHKMRIIGVTKDGRRIHISLSGSIIYDEDGHETASVGVFTDLTEMDAMHEEIQTQQQALIACEKLSSLGKLAAGVAHEINNPLTGILAFVEDLIEESEDGDPRVEEYEIILRETMRCREIVKNLLDFGRQQAPKPKPNDVNEIVLRASRLVSRLPRFHNANMQADLAPDLPAVVCDATQIQQVLVNLLVNAAEALNDHGLIHVSSRYLEDEGAVRISVEDTGSGMSESVRQQIFEPFFSTKGGKTNGLGLSVSLGIIERHGGRMEVHSKVGEGTRFDITLPLQGGEVGEQRTGGFP